MEFNVVLDVLFKNKPTILLPNRITHSLYFFQNFLCGFHPHILSNLYGFTDKWNMHVSTSFSGLGNNQVKQRQTYRNNLGGVRIRINQYHRDLTSHTTPINIFDKPFERELVVECSIFPREYLRNEKFFFIFSGIQIVNRRVIRKQIKMKRKEFAGSRRHQIAMLK